MATATASKRSSAQERALKLLVVLSRAMNAINRRLQNRIPMNGLTATEFRILEALYHKGPLLLGAVQKKIHLPSGEGTYPNERMAAHGCVERRSSPYDRRQ